MPEGASALHLVLTGDPALFAIVRLSLIVSLSAVMFAALIGVPLGALIALTRFPGRELVIDRCPDESRETEDVYAAIDHAFDHAVRRLREGAKKH